MTAILLVMYCGLIFWAGALAEKPPVQSAVIYIVCVVVIAVLADR